MFRNRVLNSGHPSKYWPCRMTAWPPVSARAPNHHTTGALMKHIWKLYYNQMQQWKFATQSWKTKIRRNATRVYRQNDLIWSTIHILFDVSALASNFSSGRARHATHGILNSIYQERWIIFLVHLSFPPKLICVVCVAFIATNIYYNRASFKQRRLLFKYHRQPKTMW